MKYEFQPRRVQFPNVVFLPAPIPDSARVKAHCTIRFFKVVPDPLCKYFRRTLCKSTICG